MLQQFNELEQGNLHRYMDSISRYCDALVVYDDASTDGSAEFVEVYLKELDIMAFTGEHRQLNEIHLIRGEKNAYKEEVAHKATMLQKCLEIGSDWIFRIDADEVIESVGETNTVFGIRGLCQAGDEAGIDSYAFRNANLWRHPSFYRVDNSFNDFVSCRLWRNNGNLSYKEIKTGLHQRAVPDGLRNEAWAPIITLHYGFASDESILRKFHTYKSHGQDGWELYRLIDERTLRVEKSKPEWFRVPPEEVNPQSIFAMPVAMKA